jgi:hypothetical protein
MSGSGKPEEEFVIEVAAGEEVFELEVVEVSPTEPAATDESEHGDGFDDLLDLLDTIEESESQAALSAVPVEDDGVEVEWSDEEEGEAIEEEEWEPEEDTSDTGLSEDIRNFRRIYTTRFQPLPVEQRIALAGSVQAEELSALCFDGDVKVIHAILHNTHVGLQHARLIAQHHRNGAGLSALGQMAAFLRDAQTKRHLCRNQQTSDVLLRKIFRPVSLQQLYQVRGSGEYTERAKRIAREVLRSKFQQASGEQKAAFIFNTEGRCLNQLVGLSLGGKTAALLCRRSLSSSLLVQNLLRFAGTPPQVIKHISRQQIVKRAPHLRRLVLQHANCPSDVKRGLR